MAVFKGKDHLENGIKAALAVRNSINELPVSEALGLYKPAVSIGLASGEMISGNIGAASLKRLDYTVIGDIVNTASRLQDNASADQIVIRSNSYDKIKENFQCEELGTFQLKNKVNAVKLYNIVS